MTEIPITTSIVEVSCAEENLSSRLKKALENKKKVAIFTHAFPDPDAVGSMMGMDWLLSKAFGLESTGFYSGPVSHPQNVAMVNLLDPDWRPVTDYKPEAFDLTILVDTPPSNAGIAPLEGIKFDMVVDHHRDCTISDYPGLCINLKAGSCCGTVFHLIQSCGVSLIKNEVDAKIATALLVGIMTDTENLMSDDCTAYEFEAYASLFPVRDSEALRKIINFERPKFWVETKATASLKANVQDGVGIVGLGIIPGKHRDLIADMAQDMVQWESVDTAVAYALVDGDRIEGCVRSVNASVSVPKLCAELGMKHGKGGGKLGKGAYRVNLAGGGIEEGEDAELQSKTWDLYNEKEKQRIRRLVKR